MVTDPPNPYPSKNITGGGRAKEMRLIGLGENSPKLRR
jgi:hypothetical protein